MQGIKKRDCSKKKPEAPPVLPEKTATAPDTPAPQPVQSKKTAASRFFPHKQTGHQRLTLTRYHGDNTYNHPEQKRGQKFCEHDAVSLSARRARSSDAYACGMLMIMPRGAQQLGRTLFIYSGWRKRPGCWRAVCCQCKMSNPASFP